MKLGKPNGGALVAPRPFPIVKKKLATNLDYLVGEHFKAHFILERINFTHIIMQSFQQLNQSTVDLKRSKRAVQLSGLRAG